MADELAFLTIAEAARRIERRELSPVELTTALLRRTEALDPQLNAYLLDRRAEADLRPCEPLRGLCERIEHLL
jgi:aspartyl-tRNA(Asn)/glutamyl-tRNA(Gln) amidotransferase subunit A